MRDYGITEKQRREGVAAMARDRLQLLIIVRQLVKWFFGKSHTSQRKMRPAMWVRARSIIDRIDRDKNAGPSDFALIGT